MTAPVADEVGIIERVAFDDRTGGFFLTLRVSRESGVRLAALLMQPVGVRVATRDVEAA